MFISSFDIFLRVFSVLSDTFLGVFSLLSEILAVGLVGGLSIPRHG